MGCNSSKSTEAEGGQRPESTSNEESKEGAINEAAKATIETTKTTDDIAKTKDETKDEKKDEKKGEKKDEKKYEKKDEKKDETAKTKDETENKCSETEKKCSEPIRTTTTVVVTSVDDAVQNLVCELTITEEKAKEIVAKVTTDNNGKANKEELVKLWEAIRAKKEAMQPRFKAYDSEDTGRVTEDEALQVLTKAFDGVAENGIRAMIKRYIDGDRVNYNTFIFFYANVGGKNCELREKFGLLGADDNDSLAADDVCKTITSECSVEDFMARAIIDDFGLSKEGRVKKAELSALWLKLFG